MTTAFQIFCNCFPADAIQAEKGEQYAGPVAGRLLLPPAFRDYKGTQKSYWSPILSGAHPSLRYWKLLQAAAADADRTYALCHAQFQRLAVAMAESPSYCAYFDAHRAGCVHFAQATCGPSLQALVIRNCRDKRDAIQAAPTFADALCLMYSKAYESGERMRDVCRAMLLHFRHRVTFRGVDAAGMPYKAESLEEAFAREGRPEFAAFAQAVQRVHAFLAADGHDSESAYFRYAARMLAEYVGEDGANALFANLEENLPEFVARIHQDRGTQDSYADGVSDLLLLKSYERWARSESDPFSLEDFLCAAIEAMARGSVRMASRARALFETQAADSSCGGLAAAGAQGDACLHVVGCEVAAAQTKRLDARMKAVVGGRECGDAGEPALPADAGEPWRFVSMAATSISRAHFSLAYNAAMRDWELSALGGPVLCRPFDGAGPAELKPGTGDRVPLSRIAWFALPYKTPDGEVRFVQIYTECLASVRL